MEAFTHETRGRSRKTAIALVLVIALIALLIFVGTMTWLIILVTLFALPALADLIFDPRARFTLTDKHLRWQMRRQEAEIALSQIEKVRFDGRLDLSTRITLILKNGKKQRLPSELALPHRALEAALSARDIRVERHPFTLL